MVRRFKNPALLTVAAVAFAQVATAQENWRESYTLYGTPGLIEMPSAQSAPDGTLAVSVQGFALTQRTTFTFQLTDRLSGSFRYSHENDAYGPDTQDSYDRSFDLRYRLVDEGQYVPAIAIGLQDFIGTGRSAAEYVVATKTLTDTVRVSAGIGWGRLGSYNGFTNPLGAIDPAFETRPERDFGAGGTVAFGDFFRGDAALFGGVEWRINPDLTFRAEYSSDAYTREAGLGSFAPQSPVNLGLTYHPNQNYELSLYSLYGTTVGAGVTFLIDPKTGAAPSGFDPAPIPVAVRPADVRAAQSWDRATVSEPALRDLLAQALALEGIDLNAVALEDRTARLRYTNTRYRAEPQAMGRIARILTQVLPPSIEVFVLEPMQRGIPLSATTLRRSDLESLENEPDAAGRLLSQTRVTEVGGAEALTQVAPIRPAFSWGIAPFAELTLFDGENPARADFGLELSARYEVRPNVVISGAIRKRVLGDRDDVGSISDSTLPPVRRNIGFYAVEGDPGIEYLTLAAYGRPAPNLYGRVTVGYLERMFGGISTEVLWKPVDSRLALGAEVNYVAQREYDMGFGFQDYTVATGHVSAYYDFNNDFHGQIDVGRYLAGDWGATFSLDREFRNGWRIGGYFTLTDVPFEDFGEGSFDKGIKITIPIDWAIGTPSRRDVSTNLSSLSRDGGARLNVDGRLYDVVRNGHSPVLTDSWGRFWR